MFLERHNFETQVEINKTIEVRDGTVVQSEDKRLISVYPKDLPSLDSLLTTKLRLFGFSV